MPGESPFRDLLINAIYIYQIIIFVRVILSWFIRNPHNQFYRLAVSLTEPVLKRIRDFLPRMAVDFSPFIAMLLLELLSNLIFKMR